MFINFVIVRSWYTPFTFKSTEIQQDFRFLCVIKREITHIFFRNKFIYDNLIFHKENAAKYLFEDTNHRNVT